MNVPKKHGKKVPFVRTLSKRKILKTNTRLQSYFIQRMEKYINAKGKQIIGWDEILEGGLGTQCYSHVLERHRRRTWKLPVRIMMLS
jgi:N-acetyl-beta-hexosaminidase